jgi:hypothetical protein
MRGRPAAALIVIAVSLGLVGVLDLATDPVEVSDPEPVALAGSEAVSGRSVCAVGDERPGTGAVVDLVRTGDAGDPPAVAEARVLDAGASAPLLTTRLFPGAGARVDLEAPAAEEPDDPADDPTDGDAPAGGDAPAEEDAAEEDAAEEDAAEDEGEGERVGTVAEVPAGGQVAADVRWSGAPVAVNRSWRLDGEEDLPPGTASGPCAPGTSAERWTLPGLATDGGHEARLRLANPHAIGATVSVGFLTPEGPEDPTRLRNVSVGPEEVVELVLNEFLPEQPDLAAVVAVQSGRVAVEGVQLTRNAIGGIDGVSLLQAATAPAASWTVPWVVDGEGRASWLWIANESDRSAPVELSLHTEDGGVVPEGLAEVSIPPGTVRRVDLRGTLPEGLDSAAVTALSDGVPITVSAVAQLSAGDPDQTGFAVQLGGAADPQWTLAGTGREGRNEQVRLVNPGSEAATVDIGLWNGSNASTPAELSGIEVPPGALVVVPVTGFVQDAPSWALTVRATSGEVVAGTVGSGDPAGPRHLVATLGAPSQWWQLSRVPILRSAPGTTQRLGTELGIAPIDPLAPPEAPDPDGPSGDVPEDEPAGD